MIGRVFDGVLLTAFLVSVMTAGLVGAGALEADVTAGVVVTDPAVLPPPGSESGWVDHPCSTEVRYDVDWVIGGNPFTGTFAVAREMIVKDIGTPVMTVDGDDVLTTFAATLYANVTSMGGQPVAFQLVMPGSMTVRIKHKVGKTTGAFLTEVEQMSFTVEAPIGLNVRQDPTRKAKGAITITDIGGGSFEITSGLEVYSQLSAKDSTVEPPVWLPHANDVNAPTHYELRGSSCPLPIAPIALFTWAPATPVKGTPVAFSDTSTGLLTSWRWDFGDGTTSSDRNPTHTFASAATFPVRLTVTNVLYASSKTSLVTVDLGVPNGDANGDGSINVADVFYLINSLFAGGPPAVAGDANMDGTVNVSDVFYLINYLFAGGPPPA